MKTRISAYIQRMQLQGQEAYVSQVDHGKDGQWDTSD